MEDDEREDSDREDWRGGIHQTDTCRYTPSHPERRARRTKALAKGRGAEHGYPEGNETHWQDDEPRKEQRVEYGPGCLPRKDEHRLILRGRSGSVIEAGEPGGSDMLESFGHEHAEPENAQDAPEESGREARPPQSSIQGEEVDDP